MSLVGSLSAAIFLHRHSSSCDSCRKCIMGARLRHARGQQNVFASTGLSLPDWDITYLASLAQGVNPTLASDVRAKCDIEHVLHAACTSNRCPQWIFFIQEEFQPVFDHSKL